VRLVKLSHLLPTWFALRLAWLWFPPTQLPYLIIDAYRYLQESSHMPTIWEKEGGKTPGTPPLQQIKLTLMSRLGYSELQAFCTPLALAFWDFCGICEMEGRLELADEEALAAARQVIEEARAGQGTANGARRRPIST